MYSIFLQFLLHQILELPDLSDGKNFSGKIFSFFVEFVDYLDGKRELLGFDVGMLVRKYRRCKAKIKNDDDVT